MFAKGAGRAEAMRILYGIVGVCVFGSVSILALWHFTRALDD